MIFLPKAGFGRLFRVLLALLIVVILAVGAGLSLFEMAKAAPRLSRTTIGSDVIFSIAPQNLTITSTQTLTPTGSMYVLAPDTVLTLTLSITDAKPGDLVFFLSSVATTTTFVDTGATAGGSTRTLALDDVIGFIFSNGKWVEAFFSDNS